MSLPQHIFETGRNYRVRHNFTNGPSNFIADEILSFERDGYSYYDNCSVYEFRSKTNELKSWCLFKNNSVDSWQQYFEPM